MRSIALISLLTLLASSQAAGQIVNVLPVARNGGDGASAVLTLAADRRTGATDLLLVSGGVRLTRRSGATLALAIVEGEVGDRGGDRFAAHHFQHVRYRARLSKWLHAEAFAQHEANRFRRLGLRVLAGAGLRAERALGDSGTLAVGSAYMPERERLREGAESDAGQTSGHHRWSSYASVQWAPSDGVTLSHTTFMQPRLDVFGDWRALSETAITSPLGARASVRLSLTLTHDSRPPEGVTQTDTRTKTAVGLRF
jgi:hypothetical protein